MPPILLLHLSDPHLGSHSRFLGEHPERLGESFLRALAGAQHQIGLQNQKVDLVVVTGDVAEAGKRSEFEEGRRFFVALASGRGLVAGRFVFVRGNHDINWASCKLAEAELEVREEPRRPSRHREASLSRRDGARAGGGLAGPQGRGAPRPAAGRLPPMSAASTGMAVPSQRSRSRFPTKTRNSWRRGIARPTSTSIRLADPAEFANRR